MASPTHLDPANEIPATKKALTTIDLVGGIHCHICQSTFKNKKNYDVHYVKHESVGTDIVYTCVVCQKSITGYPSFRGHCYSSHVIKDKFKCDYCDRLFSKFVSLKEHIEIIHKFKCSSCNKEFQSKKEMQIHQIIHNSDYPPYNCQSCERQIDSLDGCEHHIDLHSSFSYCCPVCGETSTSKNMTVKHLTVHFGDESIDKINLGVKDTPDEDIINKLGGIFCCVCSTVHKDRTDFDAHFFMKHKCEDIVYTCNVCKKQYDKYSTFGNHCYYHFMKNRFECDQCCKTFPRLSLLATHTEAYHASGSLQTKPFVCTRCDHRVATLRALRVHLRDQHNVSCVQCPRDGCERIFETPKELTIHQRQHDCTQNWCRLCGLLLATLSSCEKHLDVHRKKAYICPVCSRSYGEKHLVMKHIPKHFETVVHICKVCGKIYNAKNRLVQHMKTHSSVKTHTCTLCDKGFFKHYKLQEHMNTHTGVKPYKCAACPKTFASYSNWNKHVRRMHNIEVKGLKKFFDVANERNSEISTDASSSKESTVHSESELIQNQFEIDKPNIESNPYELIESDDSTMESDSIDATITENELNMFETVGNMCTDVLPENTALFVPETPEASLVMDQQTSSTGNYPLEYGPEFNSGLEPDGSGFIDLDDHILPHINPLLTIRNEQPLQPTYVQSIPDFQYEFYDNTVNTEFVDTGFVDTSYVNAEFEQQKWEPIITKVYQDYACGYGDIAEASRLSVMNTDIF